MSGDNYGRMAPKEVTEERWHDMLCVLPPSKWRGSNGSQSFHVCEYLSGNFVSWFVNIGARYFELQDVDSLTHAQLVDMCQGVKP
jgi:hypothetical protein